jgi:V8-like Glu-specific endopeptidase
MMSHAAHPSYARHLRSVLAARTLSDRDGDLDPSRDLTRELVGVMDVTDRVAAGLSSVLARETPEHATSRATQYAKRQFLDATHRTMTRLDEDPDGPMLRHDAMIAEAIVVLDGTRPSLQVRDGAADPGDPDAAQWSDEVAASREALKAPVRAVGRIDAMQQGRPLHLGTCWVVDHAKGLVLTNLHVLKDVRTLLPHRVIRAGASFRITDDVFVDFFGEAGSAATNRFRVVEGVPSGIDGDLLVRLDAAVLMIEPADGDSELPGGIGVVGDLDAALGRTESVCVVGFPGPPQFPPRGHDGVDWVAVAQAIFQDRYGVKRLAPGVVNSPLGTFPGDDKGWAFGHDASTLGGSSGSPVLNWMGSVPRAFGLHFAGESGKRNAAHAFARCMEELGRIGVPVALPPG